MPNQSPRNRSARKLRVTLASLAVLLLAVLTISHRAGAQIQTFSSGSTGSDGDLNITAPGVTYLDPKSMMAPGGGPLNPAGDNIFNFKTITIATGSILKISELKVHAPVYFLAQGDVTINGAIDLRGDDSPGTTPTAAEQNPVFAGSGGYSGGLGGVHNDSNDQALNGNGPVPPNNPGFGAAGDINSSSTYAGGGAFTTNRFLVPLTGGSGAGGTNDNGVYGSQGGAGGGALMIASSTKITLSGNGATIIGQMFNGLINARGGYGGGRGCGGAGGAVRLVSNTIVGSSNQYIYISGNGGNGGAGACKSGLGPQSGLLRIEANNNGLGLGGNVDGPYVTSLPFQLNLPTAPPPVITVASINGIAINANPFSFPDATINTSSAVPVVIKATNMPTTATVTLYTLSDTAANQSIAVTMQGNLSASQATVNVLFPSGGTRGFVKATW